MKTRFCAAFGFCMGNKSRIRFSVFVLLCALFISARADSDTFSFGGSGVDQLLYVTIGEDGQILLTGRTDSVDGIFEGRDGTGNAGWAMCIDQQGKVLWNTCIPLERGGLLCDPVFQENGDAAIVLDAHDVSGSSVLETIYVNADGAIINREALTEAPVDKGFPSLETSFILQSESASLINLTQIPNGYLALMYRAAQPEGEYHLVRLDAGGVLKGDFPLGVTFIPALDRNAPLSVLPDGSIVLISEIAKSGNDRDAGVMIISPEML